MDEGLLKAKIKEAAKTITFIFPIKITGFKIKGDRVFFYNGKKDVYDLSVDEIMSGDF